jgi:recombinational DNA repair protein RecR
MDFDFKITAWERVNIGDDKEEKILKGIEDGTITSSNDIFNTLAEDGDMNVDCRIQMETQVQMSVAENGHQSTIEVIKDTETIFENTPKVKPLYYVVENELEDIDGVGESNGNKTIQLYLIENNAPKEFGIVYTSTDVSSEEAINEYFEDKDLNIDEYELKIL